MTDVYVHVRRTLIPKRKIRLATHADFKHSHTTTHTITEPTSDATSQPEWRGYIYAVALTSATMLQALVHHQYFFRGSRIGMHIRVACTGLLFDKSLSLGPTAFVKTTTGQVVNLLSGDVFRWEDLAPFAPYVWNAPLEALVVLYLIYRQIGVAAFFGFAVLLLMLPSQFIFSKRFATVRAATSKHTDARIKVVNEVLTGVEITKQYNWEEPLLRLVQEERAKEVASIRRAVTLKATNLATFFAAVGVINIVTFVGYKGLGNTLRAQDVFVSMGFFGIIIFPMVQFFPWAVEKIRYGAQGFF